MYEYTEGDGKEKMNGDGMALRYIRSQKKDGNKIKKWATVGKIRIDILSFCKVRGFFLFLII
jgi:hypothetical protein